MLKILSCDVYARMIRVGECRFVYYTEPFKEKVFFHSGRIFQDLFMIGDIETVYIAPSLTEEGKFILTSYTTNLKNRKRSERKNYL